MSSIRPSFAASEQMVGRGSYARTPSPRQQSYKWNPLEEKPAQSRLVFVQESRGLPSLERGWRTPDPSPAPGLPKCASSYPCIVDTALDVDSTEASDYHKGTSTRRESSLSTIPNRSRTPSCDDDVPLSSIRTPTPSPERFRQTTCLAPYQVFCVPCTPSHLPFAPDAYVSAVQAVSNDQCESPTEEVQTQQLVVPFAVSVGSKGHPYSCADACKFAGKSRGCKDGAECDHCHLCKWFSASAVRNYRGRLSKDPKSRRSNASNPSSSKQDGRSKRSQTGAGSQKILGECNQGVAKW
jgi:hypothetical protein